MKNQLKWYNIRIWEIDLLSLQDTTKGYKNEQNSYCSLTILYQETFFLKKNNTKKVSMFLSPPLSVTSPKYYESFIPQKEKLVGDPTTKISRKTGTPSPASLCNPKTETFQNRTNGVRACEQTGWCVE